MSPVNRIHEERLGWNGRIRTYQGSPFTGVGFGLYPSGALMFEIPYIDGWPDGLMNEWDELRRIVCMRDLGNCFFRKVEKDGPAAGGLTALVEGELGRRSPESPRAIAESVECSCLERTEYQYDTDGNMVYRLEIR